MENKTGTGLQENIASLLCYLFGWVSGLIFFFLEPNNSTVRFHAMQSILLSVTFLVLYIIFFILTFIVNFFGFFLFILGLAFFILVVILMIKAYQGQKLKLPLIGNYAEKFATKSNS